MGPLTNQMKGALQFLASSGEMEVRSNGNRFVWGEISPRTAWALERRGLVERRWTGTRHDHIVYVTDKGREVADALLPLDDDEDIGGPNDG